MRALLQQLRASLRLHFRNPMALIYGYAFPTIFLIAFWVLYRYDRVPLVRHMGELLTVTVLGGACFGLPTTLVSERERGVWRRIRLAPVSMLSVVGSTVAARYVLLILAALLQIVLAMLIGMPFPRHPIQLGIAFTAVAFAFLGLGMVIATLADNVPAVQALGQCIFLPMLIIGGVAVPLASLPDWAQHLSAFFPGRYAVEALQAAVNGNGLAAARFSLLALVTIGAASAIAGTRLFRWDAQQRFMGRGGKGWIAAALVAWIAVGVAAEAKGRIASVLPAESAAATPAPSATAPASIEPAASPEPSSIAPATPSPATTQPAPSSTSTRRLPPPPEAGPSTPSDRASAPSTTGRGRGESAPPPLPLGSTGPVPGPPPVAGAPTAAAAPETSAAEKPSDASSTHAPASWQAVTMQNIDDELVFNRLPPDNGVVTPIATSDQQPDQDVSTDLDALAAALPDWAPGKVADPVQRVRNLLYVPSVVDVFQLPSEPYVPLLVFDQIEQQIPKDDLIKILYWIAVHPDQGDDSAVSALRPFGIQNGPSDLTEVRGRAGVYAVKLLGRITGKRPGK
ncbi:MAG TPA: ABC transporter permease [Vicinamibacterales bacterium]|nr:ABC transporter permease [Vicinamibacterales bacterium]